MGNTGGSCHLILDREGRRLGAGKILLVFPGVGEFCVCTVKFEILLDIHVARTAGQRGGRKSRALDSIYS